MKMAVRNKRKKGKCGGTNEFRKGMFVEGSHLDIYQILAFVNLWVLNISHVAICSELEINKSTAVDWASFTREVLLHYYLCITI